MPLPGAFQSTSSLSQFSDRPSSPSSSRSPPPGPTQPSTKGLRHFRSRSDMDDFEVVQSEGGSEGTGDLAGLRGKEARSKDRSSRSGSPIVEATEEDEEVSPISQSSPEGIPAAASPKGKQRARDQDEEAEPPSSSSPQRPRSQPPPPDSPTTSPSNLPQTPRRPPPDIPRQAAAPATTDNDDSDSSPRQTRSRFEVTDTEKALPGQQGWEMWVAEDPVLSDVGGRRWEDRPRSPEDDDEEADHPQRRNLDTLSKRIRRESAEQAALARIPKVVTEDSEASEATGDGPARRPSYGPPRRYDDSIDDGSFTGVGSSSAYKRPSLPPGAAPAATPGPQRSPLASPNPETRLPPSSQDEEIRDDIIGAVTVDRSGRHPEYAALEPAILGRAVSRTSPGPGRTPSATSLSIPRVPSTDVLPQQALAARTSLERLRNGANTGVPPAKRASSGSQMLLNQARAPTPPTGAGGKPYHGPDGESTLRASKSTDLMRNSLPPMAGWSRYPSPAGFDAGSTGLTTPPLTAGGPRGGGYPITPAGLEAIPSARGVRPSPPQGPYMSPPLTGASTSGNLAGLGATPRPTVVSPVAVELPAPEVCVECMMRDQDMADVDVTGPGVWARKSDYDFEEAIANEEAEDIAAALHRRGSVATSGQCSSGEETFESAARAMRARAARGDGSSSRESVGPEKVRGVVMGTMGGKRKRRIGRGQPLTQPSLKLWTQMTPPASSHRWRTLQVYLQEQAHLLDIEQKARISTQLESERAEYARRRSVDANTQLSLRSSQGAGVGDVSAARASQGDFSFLNSAPPARGRTPRSSTVLPNGMIVEMLDVSRDEKEAKVRAKSRNRQSRASMPSPGSLQSTSPAASMRSYSYGDQPWLATDQQSRGSPQQPSRAALGNGRMGASTNDLAPATPRSRSPSRYSVNSRKSALLDGRPFMFWGRGRRSGSHSVFSFAPSGSMIDMHVGLSQDRHAGIYGGGLNDSTASFDDRGGLADLHAGDRERSSGSDRASSPVDERKEKEKKKKGFKGFLNKLGIGGRRPSGTSTPLDPSLNRSTLMDDEPLAPPPPLSVLARERNGRHSRNGSTVSLSANSGRFEPGRAHSAPFLSQQERVPDSAYGSPASTYGPLTPIGSAYARNSSYDMLAEELTHLAQDSPPAGGKGRYRAPQADPPVPAPPPETKRSNSSPQVRTNGVTGKLKKEKSLPRLPRVKSKPRETGHEVDPAYFPNEDEAPRGTSRISVASARAKNASSPLPDGDRAFDTKSIASTRTNKTRSRVLSAVMPKLRRGSGGLSTSRSSSFGMPSSPDDMDNPSFTEQLRDRDYLPSDRTKHAVSRSPDFVALRYAVPTGGR